MDYSIGKRCDQWVVSAHGIAVLCCQHKKMALLIVRQAVLNLPQKQKATEHGLKRSPFQEADSASQ